MSTQHTPGPWVAVARTNAYIEIEAPNQPGYSAKKVATASLTNHEANARLIAAAPDLLEALNAAEALLHSLGMQSSDAYQEIDAAIAKATWPQGFKEKE